ncbi:hypothetical protein N8T08_000111 [Aspergillus melleus]|uniref:Uncharacterized protein n=1 Tax=Aspergillus melleus TaxID=138277 RepID=A0ACC3BHQ6_9EURO|nr:hypothetical protein N8T08_000111 [Aspergillus melleus]
MATAPADSWHVGMQFNSMKEARDALVRHSLDLHASFRVEKANSEKYFTACRSGSDCPYKVRMYTSRKTGLVRIQTYEPLHTCSSDTHDSWRPPVPTAPEAEGSTLVQPKSSEQVRNEPEQPDPAASSESSPRKAGKPPKSPSALFQQGLHTRRAVLGEEHVDRALANNASAFSSPMQEIVTEWAWGNIWNRPGLDRKQRSLMNIGLLMALNRTPELAMHIRGAINNGLSEVEIREAILHSTVYCGAPAGMEATRTAERVLQEMAEKGELERALT